MSFSPEFYQRPTLEVAKDLLGQYLVYDSPQGTLIGEINEVESYIGEDDPACHAARGKTPRTAIMYRHGGYSYIYFIYGMYYCLNVVTEGLDCPAAILIRSVIPVQGQEIMRSNRQKLGAKPITDQQLTNGPGKLCTAFGLTKAQNALDLNTSELRIEPSGKRISTYSTTARVGIKVGQDKLWRYHYN